MPSCAVNGFNNYNTKTHGENGQLLHISRDQRSGESVATCLLQKRQGQFKKILQYFLNTLLQNFCTHPLNTKCYCTHQKGLEIKNLMQILHCT